MAITRRIARALSAPFRAASGWWVGLEPPERVLYRALVLLGPGCALIYPPAGLVVPGVVLALVFFGFSLRRS